MTSKQRLTLLATILGSGIVIVDGTVVNIALPHISESLNASLSGLQWIIDAYLLTLSALILLGGSLGDILGRKKIYLIGLGGFGFASLLCGLAPNTPALVGARALQGVFGALLVPGGLANINANFEKGSRAAAIGIWSAWSALAAAIGPLLGGYIVDSMSWRWIFIINIPLVLVCLVLAVLGMKETRSKTPRKIDILGAVTAASGLAGLTFGLIEGPVRNWDTLALSSIVGGLALLIVFVWHENRSRDPMVKPGLFRSRNFTGANLMTFAMYGALSAFLFALVLHLQNELGYSGTQAGLSLLPITVMLLGLSSRVGKLAGTLGPRRFLTIGPFVSAVGIAYLYRLSPGADYWTDVLPGVALFASGLALIVSPLTITVMSAAPDEDSGIASGINNAVSRVAGLITVASLGIFAESNLYKSTIILCATLTAIAGVLSFWFIRTPHKKV